MSSVGSRTETASVWFSQDVAKIHVILVKDQEEDRNVNMTQVLCGLVCEDFLFFSICVGLAD